MRRLNKVVVETLKDPTTRDAVLEVYDLYADEPVARLQDIGSRKDTHRVAGLLQDIVIAGAPTDPVSALLDALDGALQRVVFCCFSETSAALHREALGRRGLA